MIRHLKRKGALALLAAAALTVVAAAPAAADEYIWEITEGTAEVDGSTIEPINLGQPPEADPCDLGWSPPQIDTEVEHQGTPPNTTADVVVEGIDFSPITSEVAADGGNWYYLSFDLTDGFDQSGEVDSNYDWTQNFAIDVTIANLGRNNQTGLPGTCNPAQTCTATFDFGTVFGGPLTGQLNHGAGTAHLSGTTVAQVAAGCGNLFLTGQVDGKDVTLDVDLEYA